MPEAWYSVLATGYWLLATTIGIIPAPRRWRDRRAAMGRRAAPRQAQRRRHEDRRFHGALRAAAVCRGARLRQAGRLRGGRDRVRRLPGQRPLRPGCALGG